MSMTVNDLADMIASIEHWRAGPDTLAGELLPLIERHIAAGMEQPAPASQPMKTQGEAVGVIVGDGRQHPAGSSAAAMLVSLPIGTKLYTGSQS